MAKLRLHIILAIACLGLLLSCGGRGQKELSSSKGSNSTSKQVSVPKPTLNDSAIIEPYENSNDSIVVKIRLAELIDTNYIELIKTRIVPILVRNKYSTEYGIVVMCFSPKHTNHVSFYTDFDTTPYVGIISDIKSRVFCSFNLDGYNFIVRDDIKLSTEQKQSLFQPKSQTRSFVLGKEPVMATDGGPEWVYSINDDLQIQEAIYEVEYW